MVYSGTRGKLRPCLGRFFTVFYHPQPLTTRGTVLSWTFYHGLGGTVLETGGNSGFCELAF